jgi:hypothetical protein
MPDFTAVSRADIYIQHLSALAHTRDLVTLARSEVIHSGSSTLTEDAETWICSSHLFRALTVMLR